MLTRKRSIDELQNQDHHPEGKRRKVDPKESYYLVTKAQTYDEEIAVSRHKKALKARAAAKSNKTNVTYHSNALKPNKSVKKGHSNMRKNAVLYQFIYVHEEVNNSATITSIMKNLEIPKGSRNSVINIIDDYESSEKNPDLHRGERNRGRNPIIESDSMESFIILEILELGISL